eukprot:CAMPEP_0194027572 /NCGR_PEP_ID=MMETSP0009_2-20130614/1712_1 /TAXON_ID=210454 /ORGANISM="Grammatophora oceanica, Strain CCMP 410" /LENGTH=149 /DNA_ID=CAMNT_0038666695 /DNA_START=63 /DNA_END=512 /DNA_ORIENTATION=-
MAFATIALLILLLAMFAAAEDLKLVPFAKTTLDYPIGEKEVELFATASATVQDLKANVGSDAVWLKEKDDEIGDYLDDDTILHDIPDLESKMLNIVASDAFDDDRPGDATQVDIRGENDGDNTSSAVGQSNFSSSILAALSTLSLVLLG